MTKDSTTSSTKKHDDLNAVRTIREALEGFNNDERERIIRWARESLGLSTAAATGAATKPAPTQAAPATASPTVPAPSKASKDIATFVREKDPQTDIQLATTIAYYYRFEAPPGERREEIDADFLGEACRLAGRPGKLVKPLMTLNNAHGRGLLDRGSARGKFVINSVGENLVGMTLPGGAAPPVRTRNRGSAKQKKAPKPRG